MTELTLSSPIIKLHGFGKKAAQKASLLGIKTVHDLLTYFPFRYNDYRSTNLDNEPDKAQVSIVGRVATIPNRKYHGRLNTTTFKLAYHHEHKSVWVQFFNAPWLVHKIHMNSKAIIYGQFHRSHYWTNINGSRIKAINGPLHISDIVKPVYPSSHHIHQNTIQKMVKSCYRQTYNLIHEVIPEDIRRKYNLESEPTVIHDMHFPRTAQAEHLARRTAKFNEFYLYEAKIAKMKANRTKSKGIAISYKPRVLRSFDNHLPFKMTEGQLRSVYEIVTNLHDHTQMNRLLQGDVGSGKTVVAAFGILAAITAGYQAAIMIPTSVLGKQHYKSFTKMFKDFNITIVLLTSDMKPMAKRKAIRAISSGKAQLVIGTDALIQPVVKFKHLGLAVIDEQHKFGVSQRKALINKGRGVNALSMTATPIPRTLAITAYGDMDVSIIDTLPKGRKPVITKWIKPIQFGRFVPFFKGLLAKGQQAYCVVPLVKQTNNSDAAGKQDKLDAITAYHKFTKVFSPYKVGVLYGPMPDDKKDRVLQDFKSGKIQFLVSTTVIEVGVDAPKATMMIIMNAERAGLASLHQLRGRVGRNLLQSYCLLISNPRTPQGRKRMRIMESTNNGFVVAQADLKLRGGGNPLGEQQAGVPQFKVGDPIGDESILVKARNAALIKVQKTSRKEKYNA